MVATRFEAERMPDVRGHLDVVVQKRLPSAVDHVVYRAIVFERIAARNVIVVRIAIPPDDPGPLIALPGDRLELNGQVDVLPGEVVVYGDRKPIVGPIWIGLH